MPFGFPPERAFSFTRNPQRARGRNGIAKTARADLGVCQGSKDTSPAPRPLRRRGVSPRGLLPTSAHEFVAEARSNWRRFGTHRRDLKDRGPYEDLLELAELILDLEPSLVHPHGAEIKV